MVIGCRTCLCIIKSSSEGFNINCKGYDSNEVSLKDKLSDCVPEMLLEATEDAMLCHSCVKSLSLAYEFKQNSLEAQQKIYGYLQQMPLNTEINVGEIASYYKRIEAIKSGVPITIKYNPNQELESQICAGIAACAEAVQTKKMPHRCGLCKFSCVDECTFRQHVIMHNIAAAPYKCDECTLTFSTPELLLDHLAMHTGEKPYACTLCDFLAATYVQLKEHGWTHRKPFQCTICWLRFAQKSELDMHSKIHNVLQQPNLENSSNRQIQIGFPQASVQVIKTEAHDTNDSVVNINNGKTITPRMAEQFEAQTESKTQMKLEGRKKRKRKQNHLRQKIKVLVGPNTYMRMRKRDAIKLGFVAPEESTRTPTASQQFT